MSDWMDANGDGKWPTGETVAADGLARGGEDVPSGQPSPIQIGDDVLENLFREAAGGLDPDRNDHLIASMAGWVDRVAKDAFKRRPGGLEQPGLVAKDLADKPLVDMLAKALQARDVVARGALGNRLSGWMQENPLKSAEYKALSGKHDVVKKKREFRLSWAQQMVDETTTTTEHTTQMNTVHRNHVKFMSLDKLTTEEGGRHNIDNVMAAYTYIKNAKRLGSTLVRCTEHNQVARTIPKYHPEILKHKFGTRTLVEPS
jgi:hypothetical protein